MIIDLKRLQKKHANRHAGKAKPAEATPAPAPTPTPAPAPAAEATPAPTPAPEAEPDEKLTMTSTKTELTDAATAAGVDVQSGWTKAEILAALYPEG
jgi:outer membrane biosynthesis protein TonB